MTKVFIGGSRRLSRLDSAFRQRLDRIVARHLRVLIGDANGADCAVQRCLRDKRYDNVVVFCAGTICRNNLGNWPIRQIAVGQAIKGLQLYASKDRAMAREASVGLMIWDGKSRGTLMNVTRLVMHGKKVLVYLMPARRFVELKNSSDWNEFRHGLDDTLKQQVDREVQADASGEQAPTQPNLL
ncbi:MAG: hypothetical protein ACREQB_03085 [Candidatus Binataceae bacterium]